MLATIQSDMPIAVLFQRYYKMGRPLAGLRTHAETASEFTSMLIHNAEQIEARARHTRRSRSIEEDARQLTNLYLLSLFSNYRIEKKDAGNAFMLWRRLRLNLWRARLQKYLLQLWDRMTMLRLERK